MTGMMYGPQKRPAFEEKNERGTVICMKRERFQSRLGFLLVSAGCAVGIGNVWKFP